MPNDSRRWCASDSTRAVFAGTLREAGVVRFFFLLVIGQNCPRNWVVFNGFEYVWIVFRLFNCSCKRWPLGYIAFEVNWLLPGFDVNRFPSFICSMWTGDQSGKNWRDLSWNTSFLIETATNWGTKYTTQASAVLRVQAGVAVPYFVSSAVLLLSTLSTSRCQFLVVQRRICCTIQENPASAFLVVLCRLFFVC